MIIMDASSPYHIEIVLLWLLLCTITFTSSFIVQCNDMDRSTLLNFKHGVKDPSALLFSWFPQNDCCQWKGVICHNITGRVTELNLPCQALPSAFSDRADKSHCLKGELNLSLLNHLESLTRLNLSNHDFKALQYNSNNNNNFSNLRFLDLSYNNDLLIDDLSWVPHLSSLQYIDLSGTHLHQEIDWLPPMTMLPSLFELHLQNCQLQNIYPSLQFANFSALQVLDLSDNDVISEFPGWIFNLSCDISHIDLSQNRIHGHLPQTLPKLRSIKSLDLSQNNFVNELVPDWLGQLEHLQQLDLSYNAFYCSVPSSLGNISSLVVLHLESNLLNETLPESLGQLLNLEVLGVGYNYFSGSVSERNFLHLSKLKHLFLSSPDLDFDFDPKWIPPFDLEGIRLGYVGLPSWLFTQTSLKILTITDSRTFKYNENLWNFAELEYFCLENNLMDVDMSSVLLNSKVTLLSSNALRGGLPQISSNVVILDLHNNYFSGSISPLMCQMMEGESSLEYLDISNNLLTGELTNCWKKWKSLVHINLGNNQLTGRIPDSLGLLSNLISLHLDGNKFHGEVPLSLKNCQNLSILFLGENNLVGPIPNWIGQGAKALSLRSNGFSGNIPPQICQLNSLMMMDLANNRLSGPIPKCLHNIKAMVSNDDPDDGFRVKVANVPHKFISCFRMLVKGNELEYCNLMHLLDISSNNFSGTVPLEVFELTSLQSLNLSSNQLKGTIPEEIGNMNHMESLDLSLNQLSGQVPQSLSSLFFLDYLNLSFNNFMGEIPLGTQVQSFTNLSFMGNPQLCGPPLTKNCTQDEKPRGAKHIGEDDGGCGEESDVYLWLFMGLGIVFAAAFLGLVGAILFNSRCRRAFVEFLGLMHDMVMKKMNAVS